MDTNIIEPESAPQSIIFMLHGYGSDGNDMLGLAKVLKPNFPNSLFVCPNAIEPCEIGFGYQWFSIRNSTNYNEDTVATALVFLNNLIKNYSNKYNIPTSKIILMGFSQGGMVASWQALASNEKYAGLIGCSTRLIYSNTPNNNQTAFLLTHGKLDEIIPYQEMLKAEKFLTNHSIKTQTLLQPELTHSIDNECINTIKNFINTNLS